MKIVLNIIYVELKQLTLHILLHSVTLCGSKCNFNYIYIYIAVKLIHAYSVLCVS